MVSIEYSTDDDDNGPYGDQYDQPGAGTQDAATALMSFGLGAASGEKQMTPEQLFKHSNEKKNAILIL